MVQGVFFRAKTKVLAHSLGLKGWVRNAGFNQLEIVAEGEKEKLEKLISWAKKGPSLASVKKIKVNFEEMNGEFEDFEIKYD